MFLTGSVGFELDNLFLFSNDQKVFGVVLKIDLSPPGQKIYILLLSVYIQNMTGPERRRRIITSREAFDFELSKEFVE